MKLLPIGPSRLAIVTLLIFGMSLSACKDGNKSGSEGQQSAGSPTAHSHPVAGETCFICDPSKREPGRLWCNEHGRYEDRCWECQPQLREANRPYCEEHGLYEDECSLCNPSLAGAQPKAAAVADGTQAAALFCNEHQVPEEECGICQPQRAATLPVGESLLIRLPSERSAELAGLLTARPVRAEASTSVPILGEIRFDGNRLAEVTALSGGVISRVRADLGQSVEAGEELAVVNSPGVASARAEYLSAQADLRMRQAAAARQRGLFEDKVGSRRAMEEADAAHQRAQVAVRLARQRLLNLGIPASRLTSLTDARSELRLRAPFRGTVVRRAAVLGEAVERGFALFEIADLTHMWVGLSVPEEHAIRMRVDTPIQVRVRGQDGVVVNGRITWIGPLVDERSRMVRARAVVPNDQGVLRHGMFADVTAIVERHPASMRLPSSAISQIDNRPFVFVRKEPDLFAALPVDVGDRLPSGETVVHRGINATQDVVTDGAFVIKSALLASRLGAGCTDD